MQIVVANFTGSSSSSGRSVEEMEAYVIMRLLLLLSLLASSPAYADVAGKWALRAGDVAIMRIEVTRTSAGWSGVWSRPARFALDGGEVFSRVEVPVEHRRSATARAIGDAVELTFNDPRPNTAPDVLLVRATDADHGQLAFVGQPLEPFALVREDSAALGPWDSSRHYVHLIERPTSAEMTAIFDADQAAREDSATIDWAVVGERDRARRARTQVLLDAGLLASGDDFYHAAFVFQHGSAPTDFLKAHALAMVAIARGRPDATWIAAATLDRYLRAIDRPQVFGTQYHILPDGTATQGAYDQRLVSDALRAAMGVPPLAEQEAQRQAYEQKAARHASPR